jgi:hypothetical protein
MLEVKVTIRTPYNQMPIALTYKSIDRKLYRDQYCIECGHPFMAISDKYVAIQDGGIPIDMLRGSERVLEARCSHHYCKQYYRVEV